MFFLFFSFFFKIFWATHTDASGTGEAGCNAGLLLPTFCIFLVDKWSAHFPYLDTFFPKVFSHVTFFTFRLALHLDLRLFIRTTKLQIRIHYCTPATFTQHVLRVKVLFLWFFELIDLIFNMFVSLSLWTSLPYEDLLLAESDVTLPVRLPWGRKKRQVRVGKK